MAVEHKAEPVPSASESLPTFSESLRCILAGLPASEGNAACGSIGECEDAQMLTEIKVRRSIRSKGNSSGSTKVIA